MKIPAPGIKLIKEFAKSIMVFEVEDSFDFSISYFALNVVKPS